MLTHSCPHRRSSDLAATRCAVSPLFARDRRLRLGIGGREGPTTKGDNLNRLWAALGEDERAEGVRFAAIVLHDAEDHVHPDELALYRRHLCDAAMVQIPVMPLIKRKERWVGGHYGDEFEIGRASCREGVCRNG